jgi:hypothetical protein
MDQVSGKPERMGLAFIVLIRQSQAALGGDRRLVKPYPIRSASQIESKGPATYKEPRNFP